MGAPAAPRRARNAHGARRAARAARARSPGDTGRAKPTDAIAASSVSTPSGSSRAGWRASFSSAAPGVGEVGRAARSLLKSPGLTATIVLTVGLGIGGCATIFSMVDALYLRPLPYPDASRLAWIYTDAPPNHFPFSVVDFQALQEGQTSFESIAATTRGGARASPPTTASSSSGWWRARPGSSRRGGCRWSAAARPTRSRGRTRSTRHGAGHPRVRRALPRRGGPGGRAREGRDAGRRAVRDHRDPPVLARAAGARRGDPAHPPTRAPTRKGPFFLQVYGRLRPGADPAAAERELRSLNTRLFPLWADSYQDRNASWGLMGVVEHARGDAGSLLGVLMAAVAMVLLISLTNAANLLVARVNARDRELAVRAALGATRGRIWSHLLVESALLAAAGAALGLGLARGGVALLPVMAGTWLRRAGEADLTLHTVGFALALAAAGGLVFAVVPALHRRREHHPGAALRAGGRSSTASASRQRSQRLLVAGQLAIVMPLLAGAALLLGSFVRLQRVDPGFDAEHLLTMGVMLSPVGYPDGAEPAALLGARAGAHRGHPGHGRSDAVQRAPPHERQRREQLRPGGSPHRSPASPSGWPLGGGRAQLLRGDGDPADRGPRLRGLRPRRRRAPRPPGGRGVGEAELPQREPRRASALLGRPDHGTRARPSSAWWAPCPTRGSARTRWGPCTSRPTSASTAAWLMVRTSGDPHDRGRQPCATSYAASIRRARWS